MVSSKNKTRMMKVPNDTINILDRLCAENGIKTRTHMLRIINPFLAEKAIRVTRSGDASIVDRKRLKKRVGNFWEIE